MRVPAAKQGWPNVTEFSTVPVTVSVSALSVVGLPASSLVGVSVTVSVNCPAEIGSIAIVSTVSRLPAGSAVKLANPLSLNGPVAPSTNAPSRLSARPSATLRTPARR